MSLSTKLGRNIHNHLLKLVSALQCIYPHILQKLLSFSKVTSELVFNKFNRYHWPLCCTKYFDVSLHEMFHKDVKAWCPKTTRNTPVVKIRFIKSPQQWRLKTMWHSRDVSGKGYWEGLVIRVRLMFSDFGESSGSWCFVLSYWVVQKVRFVSSIKYKTVFIFTNSC